MWLLKRLLAIRYPPWMRALMLVNFILLATGYIANITVMHHNGGKMPVMVRAEDALFVIGTPTLGVTRQFKTNSFKDDPRHVPLMQGMSYAFLADRIPVGLHLFPNKYRSAMPAIELPGLNELFSGDEKIVSLGDIALGLGYIMFYPCFPFYVFYFMLAFIARTPRPPHR